MDMKSEFYIFSNSGSLNSTRKFFSAGFEFEKVYQEIKTRAYKRAEAAYKRHLNRNPFWDDLFVNPFDNSRELYWLAFNKESKFGKILLKNNLGLYHKAPDELQYENEEDVIVLRYYDIFDKKTENEILKKYRHLAMIEAFDVISEFGIEVKMIRNPLL